MNPPGHDKSAALRMHLANVGITLDEPKKTARSNARTAEPVTDREEIRTILIAAGAPERDIDWMAAACPSLAAARAYRPTDWMAPAPAPIAELEDGADAE